MKTIVAANSWHVRLRHPIGAILMGAKEKYLAACPTFVTCNINKSMQVVHAKHARHESTKDYKLENTDVIKSIPAYATSKRSAVMHQDSWSSRETSRTRKWFSYLGGSTKEFGVPTGTKIQRLSSENAEGYIVIHYREACQEIGKILEISVKNARRDR